MRVRPAAAGALAAFAVLALGAAPARAHRLDEYLQASTVAVDKDQVRVQVRLAPGVAVAPAVLAGIDADGDGVLSPAERRAYAERVLGDLSLAVDGGRVRLRLESAQYATVPELREGRGEIRLGFAADVPPGGPGRTLTFENRHQRRIAAYLVNALVPRDPDVHVTAQRRDSLQTRYRLDYVQAGGGSGPLAFAGSAGVGGWLGAAALLPLAWLASRWQRRARGTDEGAARGWSGGA